jgi:hypothetical protein
VKSATERYNILLPIQNVQNVRRRQKTGANPISRSRFTKKIGSRTGSKLFAENLVWTHMRTSVTPVENQRNSHHYYIHIPLPSLVFLPWRTFSKDAQTLTFNAISHEYKAQIVNRKPLPSYSTVPFTYQRQNIINNHRTYTMCWNKNAQLFVNYYRTCSCNVLKLHNSVAMESKWRNDKKNLTLRKLYTVACRSVSEQRPRDKKI